MSMDPLPEANTGDIQLTGETQELNENDLRAAKELAAQSGPRRSGRKPSPEKRLKILEAAVRLFTTRDYHEVLMDHVAEQAGVGKGTVYRYFPTKEGLFLELVHLAVDRASEVIRSGINSPEPPLKRLRRAVAMTLEYFRLNEPFLAILWHDKVFRCCQERKELEKKRSELRGFFARLLAEGIADGTVRPDMEPAIGGMIIMGAIRSLLRNFGSTRSSEQLADQIVTILIEGVQVRPAPEARPAMRPSARIAALDAETLAKLDPLISLNELGMAPDGLDEPGEGGDSGTHEAQGGMQST